MSESIQKTKKLSKTYEKYAFFERIARFFESDSIFSIFFKDRREQFDLFDHFHRSTRAIRSRAIFYKDRKGHKIEDRNIERSISQPWLQMKQSNLCSVHNRFYKEKNRECLVHFTYTVIMCIVQRIN